MSVINAPKNRKKQRKQLAVELKGSLEKLGWKSYRLKELSCIGFIANASPRCFEDANFNEAAWAPPLQKCIEDLAGLIKYMDGKIKTGGFEYSLSSCLMRPDLIFIKRVPLKKS